MMEQLFAYIDAIVLGLCLTLSSVFTFKMARKALMPVRKLPLFFVFLGSSLVFSAMCGHLFENSVRALMLAIQGDFVFGYPLYSRILMGVTFLSISGYMLHQTNRWLLGDRFAKTNLIKAAICLTLLTAPIVLFRPIGILPTIACIISMSALPFTVKRSKKLVLQQV
jgi:hypothetical protein